ncbi:MAG: PocR ligand-binding domain-containing protein [Desulfosalsimonadaceae bacterium]
MEYSITDVLNREKLQEITEAFHAVTGLSSSVVDKDGTVLAGSGWQEICSRFHRVNEKTARNCLKSSEAMAERFKEDCPHIVWKCPNGLYDAAAPVIVDGEHIASLFTGQFLMVRPDISDIEQFSSRARFAGFNETDYLNALEKVPTITPAQLDGILDFLKNYADILSDMGTSLENREEGASEKDAKALGMSLVNQPADKAKTRVGSKCACKSALQTPSD